MTTSTRDQFECFNSWVTQQHQDLHELLQALSSCPRDNEKLYSLTEKTLKHFEDYADNRARLAQHDGPAFLSPPWCTTFENSFLWIGGCRPSLSIRLVYSLCGSEIEGRLCEYLHGDRKGDLGEISAHQLNLINILQCKTVKEEEKLSNQMASLQEDIADVPLITIVKQSRQVGESSEDADQAMEAHAMGLSTMVMAADKLRVSTMKELMHILTPLQAIDLLVASKKLHLSIHEWGKRRDKVYE